MVCYGRTKVQEEVSLQHLCPGTDYAIYFFFCKNLRVQTEFLQVEKYVNFAKVEFMLKQSHTFFVSVTAHLLTEVTFAKIQDTK